MNVKISVKKLFNMEQIIIALKDGQKRYREQIAHMFSEHEDLKEKLNEAGCSLTRMDERIQAYQKEIEDLKSEDNDVQAFQLERKEQLVTQAESIKYLTEHNDALKKQVKTLDNRLIHANTLEEKSRGAWIELHGKKIDLEIQCKALKQEVEDLKKDRNDWEDAARSAADNL